MIVRKTISCLVFQVDFLVKHTAYNPEEVVDWHNAFLEDNPEGTLGKVQQQEHPLSIRRHADAWWPNSSTRCKVRFQSSTLEIESCPIFGFISGQDVDHVFLCIVNPQGVKYM